MIHGLDIVAVGVEGKGCVVAGVVFPFTRRPVIATAGRQNRCMKAVNHRTIPSLEGEMDMRDGRADINP